MLVIMAVVMFAVAVYAAVSAVRGGAHGYWKSVRWAASAAAFAGSLAAALSLLA